MNPLPHVGGAGYVLKGLTLLREPVLRPWLVGPLLASLLIWAALAALVTGRANALVRYGAGHLPDWLDWLAWLIWPLLVLLFGVLAAYGFAAVTALVAAPFYAALARRVELLLDPGAPQPPPAPLLREIPRCLWAELRKLAYFAMLGVPLLISLWIPGVNVVTAPLWLLWGAWLLAVEYLDFAAGNHGHDFSSVRALARRTPVRAVGFGAIVLVLLAIPVVNLIAMPAAVMGATAWWVDLRRARLEKGLS